MSRDARQTAAVFLLGAGTSWNAGNVGPVVGALESDLDISLTVVGLLSGTLLFASMVAGIVIAPRVAERITVVRAARLGCLLCVAGNLLFAAGAEIGALAVGRVLAGAGLGFAGVIGPVYGRATGGIGRVGVFGASFQFGIAGGLGVGSLLADAGVEWRVGFLVSALVALSSVPLFRSSEDRVPLDRGGGGFLRAAAGSPQVLRLTVLFLAMFGVPLTLGAWIVHYLAAEGGMRLATAGGLAFLLFAMSALMRVAGARLSARGVGPAVLAGMMPWLAAAGLVAIAVDQSFAVALAAVLLMGAGFALPYAVMMVEAQKLFPPEPAEPVALLTMIGTGIAIGTVPLLGSALDSGEGSAGLVVLAAAVVVAGIVNLRPAGRSVLDEHG